MFRGTKDFAQSQPGMQAAIHSLRDDLFGELRASTDHAARRAAELIVLFAGLLFVTLGILLWLSRRPRVERVRSTMVPGPPSG